METDYTIEGRVTDVNEDLLYFKIDHIYVLTALLLTSHCYPKFPELNDYIIIRKVHMLKDNNHTDFFGKIVYCLCSSSKIYKKKSNKIPTFLTKEINLKKSFIANYMQQTMLGQFDLLTVIRLYETGKKKLFFKLKFEVKGFHNFIKDCLNYLVSQCSDERKKYLQMKCDKKIDCLSIVLPNNIQIITPDLCHYVEHKQEFPDFPLWSFGTHWSENNTVLLAHCYGHSKLGIIFLESDKQRFPCLIVNANTEDILQILNQIILISKWCIFVEVAKMQQNIQYFVVDYKNIKVISKLNTVLDLNHHKESILFHVEMKSNVNVSKGLGSYFWLKIKTKYSSENLIESAFLCFNKNLVKYFSSIKIGNTYEFTYVGNISKFNQDQELKKLFFNLQNVTSYIFSNVQWYELSLKNKEQDKANCILNLTESTQKELLNSISLVSFQGVLRFRRPNKPINPLSEIKNSSEIGFGCLGNQYDILEFSLAPHPFKTLALYLKNWENTLTPLGLIPGVTVNIYNVLVHNKKYLRPTTFTYFELVSYNPPIPFQCTVLSKIDSYWGKAEGLGNGFYIPAGPLVWGRITILDIRYVLIKRSCPKCSKIYSKPIDFCLPCNVKVEINTKLTLVIEDSYGKAKVVSNNLDVLRVILDFDHIEWKYLLDTINNFGIFMYEKFNSTSNIILPQGECYEKFNDGLTLLLKMQNQKPCADLDFNCRKMNPDKDFKSYMPLWYCVEARRSI